MKRNPFGWAAVNLAETISYLGFSDIDANLQRPAAGGVQVQGKGWGFRSRGRGGLVGFRVRGVSTSHFLAKF